MKSIVQMFEALDQAKITYCHWKSNQHLDEAMRGDTDLDILFDYTQRSLIDQTLGSCGLKRFRAMPLMQYNAIEDFIGFDSSTGRIWHVHAHYRMTLGEKHLKGYILPWASKILNNRVRHASFGIYVSDPVDETLLLLLRMALKIRWRDYLSCIDNGDKEELKWLKTRVAIDEVVHLAEKRLGKQCAAEYDRLLGNELIKKRQLIVLQRALKEALKPYRTDNSVISAYNRMKREAFWAIGGASRRLGFMKTGPRRRISPTGGCVITFLGCDGAGKSTIIKKVYDELSKKIDVKIVYLGSGDGECSLLRLPMRWVAKRVGGKGLGRRVNGDADYKKRGVKQRIKANLYYIAKVIWAIALALEKKKKISKMTKVRNKGVVVLTDRYPQTEVMNVGDGPLLSQYRKSKNPIMKSLSRWEYNIYALGRENPPELVIKLKVDPKTAIERKPEMTLAEITEKIEIVDSISFDTNSMDLSSEGSVEASFINVMNVVWREI